MSILMMTESKDDIRQKVFKLRLKQSAEDRAEKSARMTEHFLQHIKLPKKGAVISGYFPVNGEIDVKPLLLELKDRGYRLALPLVNEKTGWLSYLSWDGNFPKRTSLYGIPEPDPKTSEELIPDMMIVPIVACDESCHRLGYGSGQHDRTYEQIKKIQPFLTVGVAYELQKFPAIPSDIHDYDMDAVVTEERVYAHPVRKSDVLASENSPENVKESL